MNFATEMVEQKTQMMENQQKEMGMEARSILKSIQTEHGKLAQSAQLARSDLHYFRARYNYYRLSLTRLDEFERDFIQSTLSHFRDLIMQREAESAGAVEKSSSQPPFLMPVEDKPDPSAASSEAPKAEPKAHHQQKSSTEGESTLREQIQDAIAELSLVQVALQAEPNQEKNQVMSHSLDRLIRRLKSV